MLTEILSWNSQDRPGMTTGAKRLLFHKFAARELLPSVFHARTAAMTSPNQGELKLLINLSKSQTTLHLLNLLPFT